MLHTHNALHAGKQSRWQLPGRFGRCPRHAAPGTASRAWPAYMAPHSWDCHGQSCLCVWPLRRSLHHMCCKEGVGNEQVHAGMPTPTPPGQDRGRQQGPPWPAGQQPTDKTYGEHASEHAVHACTLEGRWHTPTITYSMTCLHGHTHSHTHLSKPWPPLPTQHSCTSYAPGAS